MNDPEFDRYMELLKDAERTHHQGNSGWMHYSGLGCARCDELHALHRKLFP